MKTLSAELSCLALALAFCAPAQAVSPQTAQAVVTLLANTAVPSQASTDFEKWGYDMLGFTARSCWRSVGTPGPLPAALRTYPHRAGTYASPSDSELERLCTSLATHGYKPWCVNATAWGNRKNPDPTLPRDYMQLEKFTDQPAVRGGLNCHLSKEIITAQFFAADHFIARWARAPERVTFMTAQGPRALKSGTVMLEVPTARDQQGNPFSMPVTAVVPD